MPALLSEFVELLSTDMLVTVCVYSDAVETPKLLQVASSTSPVSSNFLDF
jgi:hypothetical protein